MRMVLIVAAVPLGNPGDASDRLKEAISSADIVAAEDSRRFHRLVSDINVECNARTISFFEGNESERQDELVRELEQGHRVLVVSDAGMPTLSDPGFRLIREAIARNLEVQVLPGPSAITTALALSGLPTDRFTFEGFLSRTAGARLSEIERLRFEERTMVFFEAPHRIAETLRDMKEIFGGDRKASLCREMTKRYEETVRGSLSELSIWADEREVLGEITLVVAGAPVGAQERSSEEIVARVAEFESAGMDRKEAIAEVARLNNLPKRLVYAMVVEANKMSR